MLGIAWVLGAGVAVLLPALIHGVYLGPFDILSTNGLTAQHGGTVHNSSMRDVIALFIPFTEQAWSQVHHGFLPLWNPYSGLGMPLAFNWESAPFGLPALIGYLVPLNFAYTVGVLVTVAVAGTGGYVFGRVLRLGVIASAFIGTVFVLSGPMMSFLGWSATSAGSWAGWLFACSVLIIRGEHRSRAIFGFAVVLAMSVYAGHPETTLLLMVGLGIFVLAILIRRVRTPDASKPVLRPVVHLVVAGVAGAALSAPLLLPGLQLVAQSGRTNTGNYSSLTIPDHPPIQLFFQGFDGSPIAGSHWFGSVSYQWTADYLGVIALVLALVALGTRWKRPEVPGLAAVAAVMAALALVPSVGSGLDGLPLIGNVILTRALVPVALGLSVLAGIGLDALMRDHAKLEVRYWAGGGFGAAAVFLAVVWLFGRGHLPPDEAHIREVSFLWPAITTAVGLAVVIAISLVIRRHPRSQLGAAHLAGVILLATQTAFLVTAGAPLWASTSTSPTPTPTVASLHGSVGTSLVGLGTESCIASTYLGGPGLGVLPESNVMYQVDELAIYDPLVPNSYFRSWRSLTGTDGGSPYFYQFCPAVTDADTARRFGVAYVLEPHGKAGPIGSIFVRALGDEDLYRIPGAGSATMVAAPANEPLPPDDAPGAPVHVERTDPSRWRIHSDELTPQVLRLRITDVPGWHASINGRPLQLERFSDLMFQARIPSGRNTIVIHYWPSAFTAGLVIAACAVVGFLVMASVGLVRRRRGKGTRHNSKEVESAGA